VLITRCGGRPLVLALVVFASFTSSSAQPASKLPLSCVSRSWAGAVVIIPAAPQLWTQAPLRAGDTLAAVTPDGRCVGSVQWQERGVALTVWMDDPESDEVDGLRAGEVFLLAAWNPQRVRELQARLGEHWLYKTLAFAVYTPERSPLNGVVSDARFIVEGRRVQRSVQSKALSSSQDPLDVTLGAPFPNPARAGVRVPMGLPLTGEVAVDVFDVQGRRVATPVQGRMEAGPHVVTLDVGTWASGLYVVRLTAGDVVQQRQFVVVE
jgi:hypothetical protein